MDEITQEEKKNEENLRQSTEELQTLELAKSMQIRKVEREQGLK